MTTEYALNAFFGLAVGFVGGYAGLGGAPFLIFLLCSTLGYPQRVAQGTVLAIMLGPMSLPGVWVMRDRVMPRLRYIAIGVLTYASVSYLGAMAAYAISSDALRLIFALALLLCGVRYLAVIVLPDAVGERPLVPENVFTFTLLGCVVGALGGLLGIGAGVVMVPALIWLFGMHKDDARAISLAILTPPVSVGAVLKYSAEGDVRWDLALIGFAAYFISNYWGAQLGKAAAPRRFQGIMGAVLVVSAIFFALQLG